MIYSFYIAPDGRIVGIKKEKSSGNPEMDLTQSAASRLESPCSAPAGISREGRSSLVAQFIYPPKP